MPVVLRVLLSFILAALLSILFTWFVFYRQFDDNSEKVMDFIREKTLIFWYTYTFILLLTVFTMSIFWRTFFGLGLTFAILAVFSYANAQKVEIRSAPIVPEDLIMVEQAGNLLEFVDTAELNRLIGGVVLLLVGTWLLDYYCRKVIGKNLTNMDWCERHAIIQRTTFTMLAYATFLILFNPLIHHEGTVREQMEWLDTSFAAWNPKETYQSNGLILSFLYSYGSTNLAEPDGYSEERIAEIYEKYSKQKADDERRKKISDVVDNVVFILDETFYDPEILGEYYAHYGGDVVPNLHRIFREHPSGYMYSPEYGGGTANVEYAAYTGFSNYWANTIPYSNFVASLERLPGLVSYVGEDFNKTAVHAYDGSMYKRNIVYDRAGYDEFLDSSTMKYKDLENGWGYISDRAVYNQIFDLLEEGEGPQLVGAATMQNHAPYTAAGYAELHFPMKNRADDWLSIESSFESLHNADKYLGEFIARLDKFDEKTLVVWFGDHTAGLLDHYIDSEDSDLANLARLTPYFIYTNFEMDQPFTEEDVKELNQLAGFVFETEGVDLPTVTPNCIMNLAYNALGVEKPVLSYLLDMVCQEQPILASSYLGATKKLQETEELKDYELINYDISHGKHYWLKYDLD